jgi:peptidyl-prolyl cis-trans isomerase B (cyclophilin B)
MASVLVAVGMMALATAGCNGSTSDKSPAGDTTKKATTPSSATKTAVPESSTKSMAPEPTKKAAVESTKEPLPQVTIQTTKGNIVLELAEDDAPNTVANFISLAEKGFYNGLTFHRVEPTFVIQGGDPEGNGHGGPGYLIADEISPVLKHDRGVISMARRGPNTAGSQFFIMLGASPRLDGQYSAFGRVTSGMDVVDRIVVGDKMIKVTVDHKRNHVYKPVTVTP